VSRSPWAIICPAVSLPWITPTTRIRRCALTWPTRNATSSRPCTECPNTVRLITIPARARDATKALAVVAMDGLWAGALSAG